MFFCKLRDAWETELATDGEPAHVDILKWLSMTTLDIIGLAGFNYEFNSFDQTGDPNELSQAFHEIFNPEPKITPLMLLRHTFPIFHLMVCHKILSGYS